MRKFSAIIIIFLIIIISGLSWIGLYTENILLASYGVDYIPMAPATSLVFLINSLVFFILLFERDEHILRIFSIALLTLLLLFLLSILINFSGNFLPDLEKILITEFVKNSSLKIGRMSPVTAFSFILLTSAALALLSRINLLVEASVAAAIIIIIEGSIILLGYWYKSPLLYQSSIIPVALPTAICITLSGIILIILIYNNSRLLRMFIGDSVRSRLLRSFLPAVVAVSLIEGWINSVLLPHWHMDNFAVTTSLYAIFETAVIGLIVFIISNQIGGAIDRTEKALSESEEKYRKLYESMMDAFVKTDMTGLIIETNSSFQKMLGYGEKELMTLKYHDITPEKWLEFDKKLIFEKILKEGGTDTYEKEYIKKDGTVIPVELRVFLLKDSFNEPSGMWAIVRDITERRKAEDDLRRSEERYRQIFENVSDAFLLTRPDGTIITVNPAGCRMFGRTEQEICSSGRGSILDVSDPRLAAALKSREQTGFFEGELTGVKADGEKFPIMASSLKFVDTDGKFSTSIIIRDITRQKEYEENLKKFNSELEERVAERTFELEKANKQLDSFAYSVSHDLRSPLRHISGFLEMFKVETADILNEKTKHYMEVIDESARRMGQLIDDLLAFSRMGRALISSNDVDTGSLVTDVMKDFSDEISKNQISIKIGPLPMVKADRAMLRVVYVNLISNAVKFTRNTVNPEIVIGHEIRDGEDTFFVRDNGAGFNMQYADKLFGVFQRLHSDRDFSGTGIGLAMVKNIIERHNGRVRAESEPGKGASFYFTLPVREIITPDNNTGSEK